MTSRPSVSLDKASVVYLDVVRALDGVSLEIGTGETVGVVGESGSGKSTLCRLLVGLTRPTDGAVSVEGQSVTAALKTDAKAFRRQIQMLMQDAVATLSPRMTIGSLMREAVAIHSLDRQETEARILALLERLRLPKSILDRYPHEISGGQARRVGVIRALLLRPSVLVADEPTAGLDVSVQGELLNLLLELQREMNLTFIMVSHNLHVIKRVTRRTIVMYLGQIVEDAPTAALFQRPAHPYSTTLLSTNPLLSAGGAANPIILQGEIPSNANPPKGCRFHTRCPVAQPACAQTMPELTKTDSGSLVRCHFPYSLALTSAHQQAGGSAD
ncbi:oligopeptide/dipeptide ABC transporter ATP-binding protein [Devosia faecipullorum]|uniref:oligopeptide/dipeptide ABC transporter ATP-binding protein n=1 Tax=Devosia faecipullorum TaxID=2755039 RepID=UPI00187B187F|nr:oligopeptide/dipeptide ABC transporter ATP-binding protein [Devosia faecipullorum]MBE7732841.1 ATP-binding cassette domain-containing protein [Devosia faecipullorum]